MEVGGGGCVKSPEVCEEGVLGDTAHTSKVPGGGASLMWYMHLCPQQVCMHECMQGMLLPPLVSGSV